MSLYLKSRISNLWRNSASGIYYARVTAGGKGVWKSPHTEVLSIAKLRLPKALAKIRAGRGKLRGVNLTLGECAAVHLERRKAQGFKGKLLKPRSLDYLQETVEMIERTWPGFDKVTAAAVSVQECQAWANRARRRYSATRFNGCLQTLRGVFKVAIESGAMEDNPALVLPRARVILEERFVPDREQFRLILMRLDAWRSRRFAALSVRGLAFTGLRPEEAANVQRADVDLEHRTLTARVTKNGEARSIALNDQAVELFQEDLPAVLRAFKKSLKRVLGTISRELEFDSLCRKQKLKPLSAYSFRKMNLTRMMECGVDVMSVAEAAGHRDRGRTLLKHYARARPDHLREQMRKVFI